MCQNNILAELGVIFLTLAVWIFSITGWVTNVYKFTQCDFESSYKAEMIRGVGIFVPPVGVIVGYITIKDGE